MIDDISGRTLAAASSLEAALCVQKADVVTATASAAVGKASR